MAVVDLFGGNQAKVDAAHGRLVELCRQEGLPYAVNETTYNTRYAQELMEWARGRPEAETLRRSLFEAVFVRGVNIAEPQVLLSLVDAAGLPQDEAKEVLSARLYSDTVDQQWTRARQVGVSAVPTFASGDYRIVGAYPTEALVRLVETAGAQKRTTAPV